MVVIDDFTRYPVIEIITSTSANAVITKLDKIFAMFGVPSALRSDNGPPFASADFAAFAGYLGFHHHRVTPLWPRANGLAERFMRNIGKVIQSAVIEHHNWNRNCTHFYGLIVQPPTHQQDLVHIKLFLVGNQGHAYLCHCPVTTSLT